MYPKNITKRCNHCGAEYTYTVGECSDVIIPGLYRYLCPDCRAALEAALNKIPVRYIPFVQEVESFEITDRMKEIRYRTITSPIRKSCAITFDSEYASGETWTINGQRLAIKVRRDNGQTVYFKTFEYDNVTKTANLDKPWIYDCDDDYFGYAIPNPADIKIRSIEPPIGQLFFTDFCHH